MAQNASEILVDTLIEGGVDIIFGLPGDGINGIVEALRRRQHDIRFVLARHEEAAAFMACAYAKVTGRLGVCLATTGPGGTHLLTGLYDAKFDGAPVLAITGLPFHDLIQTFTQQDIDHSRLFQDVAAYTTAIHGAQHVRQAVDAGLPHCAGRARRSACRAAGRRAGAEAGGRQGLAAPQGRPLPQLRPQARAAAGGRARHGRRGAERRQPDRHSRRPGRARRCAGTRAGCRHSRCARRQGAARQGGAGRHASACDRRRRLPRRAALAAGAGGVRHAADRRLELSLHRVLPQARPGALRADRQRRPPHRPALSGRGAAGRATPPPACARWRSACSASRTAVSSSRHRRGRRNGSMHWSAAPAGQASR